jgi:hypothetical protein
MIVVIIIIIIIIIIMKKIPVTLQATRTISKPLRQYPSKLPESTKLRNYQNQPCCALHTYCGKC